MKKSLSLLQRLYTLNKKTSIIFLYTVNRILKRIRQHIYH